MTVPIGPATRVVASSEQVSAELEGETVILDLAGGVYYGLDPIGTEVWSMLETERSLAELRDRLLERYQVDASTVERDLVELLSDLAARGLVELR
jgi:ornithine carbamoyltransferase